MNDDPSTAYAVVEIVALGMYIVGVFMATLNLPLVMMTVLHSDKAVESIGPELQFAIGVTLIAVAAAIT